MPNILVVGGNGFLGSHLVDALAAQEGTFIRAFDMFGNGEHWKASGVEAFDGNFLNTDDIARAVSGMDVVVHMLSTTDPATAENDPTLDVRTNIQGSIDLFRACVDAGVGHVYYASSGGTIYGDQDKESYCEDDRTLPVSPYGIGKLTIENYMRFFARKYDLKSTSLRISNPYGTRQNPHKRQGIIPIFLRHVLNGEALTVMGDGSMFRDYIYVEDFADHRLHDASRAVPRVPSTTSDRDARPPFPRSSPPSSASPGRRPRLSTSPPPRPTCSDPCSTRNESTTNLAPSQ